MEVAPFFVDFHHFLSIFTIYALLSRFTFCRDLRTFSAIFFGQNSHLRNITRFLHVCLFLLATRILPASPNFGQAKQGQNGPAATVCQQGICCPICEH